VLSDTIRVEAEGEAVWGFSAKIRTMREVISGDVRRKVGVGSHGANFRSGADAEKRLLGALP
jgi:hypothetical protein